MTADEARRVLVEAPCELRHNLGGRHAALASWSQHVRCMVSALVAAGALEPAGEPTEEPA